MGYNSKLCRHYAALFALLLGVKWSEERQNEQDCERMARFDDLVNSEDLEDTMDAWAQAFIASDSVDSEDFFDEKLEAWLSGDEDDEEEDDDETG